VTLFLALTAVQFVISADLPNSSYILKSQALVLAGYAFLGCAIRETFNGEEYPAHSARMLPYEIDVVSRSGPKHPCVVHGRFSSDAPEIWCLLALLGSAAGVSAHSNQKIA